MENNKRELIVELMRQYENNPSQFSDRQAEQIAMMAEKLGIRFPRESKAVKKFLFDTADTALLGLLPNKWRAKSRGEDIFGETQADKFAGTAGSIAGILGTGGLALAKAPQIGRTIGKGMGYAGKYAPRVYEKGAEYAGRGYSKASDLGSRAMAQGRKIYAEGPSLARRAGAGIDRGRRAGGNAFNKGTTSLDRGTSTSYFGNLRNEFMGGLNEQSLLDQALRTGSSNILPAVNRPSYIYNSVAGM